MKTTFSIVTMLLFQFIFSQNIGEIKEKLYKLEEKEKVRENINTLSLSKMNFVFTQDSKNRKETHLIKFSEKNEVDVIEITEILDDKTNTSNVYNGDYIKSENIISIRANKLNGKTIGYPLTMVLRLLRENDTYILRDIATKKTWKEAEIINKQ